MWGFTLLQVPREMGSKTTSPYVRRDSRWEAWKKRWIVTITSATGVGKTKAIEYPDATLPFPHRVIACKQITSIYTNLRAIGLDKDQNWKTHGRNWMNSAALHEQAVERAKRSSYLLILHEADDAQLV